ncbi:MAG: hypothetical protein WA430_06545 [Acidobacteriaceae bacterium]
MTQAENLDRPSISVAIRTLLLAGYTVEDNHRQPTHTEILCTAPLLGIDIPLIIAITEDDELSQVSYQQIKHIAENSARNLVVVSAVGGGTQLGWRDFLSTFGGPVPSWRALGPEYLQQLEIAAENRLPTGMTGEAWRLFEELVAAGLEFCFAWRVRSHGAKRRGSKVSDMIAQIPDACLLVVDAKATATSFDAAIHQLRPLLEYTKNQRLRQQGYNDVRAALIVSKAFNQKQETLGYISRDFLAEAQVPACFVTSEVLGLIVADLRKTPHLRSGIKWRKLFAGGLVTYEDFKAEVNAVIVERY